MRSEYGAISACIVWFFLYLAILRETRKKEVYTMVKGVSRRVIVVKSPDPRLFEEAIFIVKEEAFCGRGVSAEQVLQEARSVAKGYVKRNTPFITLAQKDFHTGLSGHGGADGYCLLEFCTLSVLRHRKT